MDKEFTTSDFELPSPERLLKYDEGIFEDVQ